MAGGDHGIALIAPEKQVTSAVFDLSDDHVHAGFVDIILMVGHRKGNRDLSGPFDHLLTTPYYQAITIDLLHLNPILDPIRDDPAFQALLEKYGSEAD